MTIGLSSEEIISTCNSTMRAMRFAECKGVNGRAVKIDVKALIVCDRSLADEGELARYRQHHDVKSLLSPVFIEDSRNGIPSAFNEALGCIYRLEAKDPSENAFVIFMNSGDFFSEGSFVLLERYVSAAIWSGSHMYGLVRRGVKADRFMPGTKINLLLRVLGCLKAYTPKSRRRCYIAGTRSRSFILTLLRSHFTALGIPHQAAYYNLQLLRQSNHLYSHDLSIRCDYDFNLRLLMFGHRFIFSPYEMGRLTFGGVSSRSGSSREFVRQRNKSLLRVLREKSLSGICKTNYS